MRNLSVVAAIKLSIIVLAIFFSPVSTAEEIAQTLSGKLVLGYQGWFGCPGDFEGNKNWQHWFLGDVSPAHFTVDMLPAMHEIDPTDLCDTGIARADGKGTIKVFSSQNANVVNAHFSWMRTNSIDGVAVQRFIAGMGDPVKRRRSDHMLQNVRAAAERNGRIFYLVYDVTGAAESTVYRDIQNDWAHLTKDLGLTSSPNYLRHGGKPLLQLWGFGLTDRPGDPEGVATLLDDLHAGARDVPAVTLIGGVPTNWRTLTGDAKRDPAWRKVYAKFDVISPWTVGRYKDEASAKTFVHDFVTPDLAETKKLHREYMPVVFPGFSWFNLSINHGKPDHAVLNRIPRACGQFLWAQVSANLHAGATMLYGAMFDELDEATALLPTQASASGLPKDAKMLTLDIDGCSVPQDEYLREIGKATRYLHKHVLPPIDYRTQ